MWLLTYISALSLVPSAPATLASDDAKLIPVSGVQSLPFPLPGIFYAVAAVQPSQKGLGWLSNLRGPPFT